MNKAIIPAVIIVGVVAIILSSFEWNETIDGAESLKIYGKIPLSFELNLGQTDNQVKFLSRGNGHTVFFTQDKAVMVLVRTTTQQTSDDKESSNKEYTILHMKMINANQTTQIIGLEELPKKSNYFIGNDPQKWHTDIPNYAKLHYSDLYPGIDLIYYGNQRQLEYDFVVAPGANPKNILLAFEGAERLSLDDEGNLIIDTINGNIVQHAPTIYQEINGIKQIVNGGYLLLDENQVGFQVSSYNAALPLVIDPMIIYSTYLGGSGSDRGFGIAVDSSGNAYVTGETSSFNFPTTNPIQAARAAGPDLFVTKINAAGNAHVYSTYLGGGSFDRGFGIAVDSSGNAYVAGETGSTDFPTTNPIQAANAGGTDTFVTKISCSPPISGDWIITSSCTLSAGATAPANVIVQNNSVLTIPNGVTLDINFSQFNLTVESGSGVLIKAGGTIT